ncbi:uncharacterized protein LOC130701665 [Daphnia carinata]|uniref:uncharacterized protein LOC130701665 n=1 Tax=Daphnia carinata TaxID=120202 RepID=UPI00257DDC55|nr:uncharacterized protein LOC130701665 [Daphnia carinata]
MKAIRYDHQVTTMTFVLLTFVVFSLIANRVAAEFYIGEYHTSVDDSSGRNRIKDTNPIFHLDKNDGRMDGSYDDKSADDQESNELFAARSNKRIGHRERSQSAAMEGRSLSTFNPLTPGGTIYLAFIFLIPLTVGKTKLGRAKSSASLSKGNGLLERLIHKVQQDQQSLYSEMGYVDGNLMLRSGWRHLRDTLAKKLLLLPWRRRFHDSSTNRRKKKKGKKSWKSPQRPL